MEPMYFGAGAIIVLYIAFLFYMHRDFLELYQKRKNKRKKR
ncbi:hypothetical protein [Helicobacter monodelphidis]|nr:hypothetical protein [Helicobacter sp. 15-1451]